MCLHEPDTCTGVRGEARLKGLQHILLKVVKENKFCLFGLCASLITAHFVTMLRLKYWTVSNVSNRLPFLVYRQDRHFSHKLSERKSFRRVESLFQECNAEPRHIHI